MTERHTQTDRRTNGEKSNTETKINKTKKGRNIGNKVKEGKDATEKEIKKERRRERESETKRDGTKIVKRKGNLKRRSAGGCWNLEEKGRQ